MLFRYSVISWILPTNFGRCCNPCHSIPEALLLKITEALLANYRMRFKSQSATGEM